MPALSSPVAGFRAVRRALAGRTAGQLAEAAGKTALAGLRRLAPAARAAARADRAFDRRWGTDTSRQVPMRQLDFPPALRRESHHYQASGAHVLDRVVALAGIDPAGFSFVDYGCGKGRIVLLASALRFAQAIGVEYAQALVTIARDNARRFAERGGAAAPIAFWQGDAAAYPPPPGDLFCYFYNSFTGAVLDGVLDRLEARSDAGRTLFAYVNPQAIDQLRRRPCWREIAAGEDCVIFELL